MPVTITSGPDQYQPLRLDRIRPSPTNPRKRFDEAALAELAESIRQKGILQPLLVRPSPQWWVVEATVDEGSRWYVCCRRKGVPGMYRFRHFATKREAEKACTVKNREYAPDYEIVAGERRFRAAQLAGLDSVPCIIRDLSDAEALEIQYVENLQRQDLDPLEEAEGYALLIDQHGYAADTLAAKLGKSKGYVYSTLKLAACPKPLKKALAAGEISKTTAALIARVPGKKAREAVVKEMASYREPWSYRQAKEYVERHYMIELKQASFDPARADLLPSAGACTTCPKRTGNNPDEYPDSRADICTDPECYRAKVAAHQAQLREQAEASGQTVLTGEAAKKALAYGNGEYTPLDRINYDDPKGRTYGKILGKAAEEHVVLAEDPDSGKLRQVVRRKDVAGLLKEKGVGEKASAAAADPAAAKRREEERVQAEADRRSVAAVARWMETLTAHLVHDLQGAEGSTPQATIDQWTSGLRLVAKRLKDELWADKQAKVARRRAVKDLNAWIDQADAPAILGLLGEFAAMSQVGPNWSAEVGRDRAAFWECFGVNIKTVKQAVKNEKKNAGPRPSLKKAMANGRQEPAVETSQPAWRNLPVASLEIGNSVSERLLAHHGLATLGQLSDQLIQTPDGDEVVPAAGLKLTRKLRELIDLACADDPAHPAGPPDDVDNPDTISVADLDLPESLWRRLDALGLSTIGDLKEMQLECGKPLARCLKELKGFGGEGARRIEEAVLGVLIRAADKPVRTCRKCGCANISKTGEPCSWVEKDLCSACAAGGGKKRTKKARVES